MHPVLLDLQLDVPPERAADRARELVAAGAAGLFGDLADRGCCCFPGYDARLDDVADFALALQ
jgi:hypothetical protein